MSTALLPREDVQLTIGNDPNKVAHYVKKDSIVDAVVFGESLEALCGHVWVPSRDPKGMPVCQTCTEIFKQMKP